MKLRKNPRLGGPMAILAIMAAVTCASRAGATTFEYAINYDGEPMTCGLYGDVGVCGFFQSIPAVSAVAGDQFHITVNSTVRVNVPGSNIGNGFFVDAYDAGSVRGRLVPGEVRSDWTVFGTGVETTALVAPYGLTTPHPGRGHEYIGFLSYGGSYGIPNAGFSATGLDARLDVVTADPSPTVGISFGYYWVTDRAAVPEPAAWATLVLGFGGVGAALRRRRTWPVSVV